MTPPHPTSGRSTGTDFLATVTHEVRTPLNAVIGMTELLRQMALPPEAASLVETIHMSGEHLLALVNDLLDSARLESGRLHLEHVDFLLRDVVEEAVEIAAATTGARRLSLAAVIDPRLPDVVRGDPRRLGQVLANLLGNAVKFTAAGHVALRIVRLAEERTHVVCRLEVEDTGIGIAPDVVPRLFEPFVQADEGTARRFGGTGLGLSIASRLIEAMGGRIEVDSAPGRGSRFRVDLRFERASRRNALALPPCEGQHVVLVSDDALVAAALQAQGDRLGVRVTVSSSTTGDLPAASSPLPVLVDARSPDAASWRRHALAVGVPVVELLPPGMVSPSGARLHLRLPVRLSALAHVLATLQPAARPRGPAAPVALPAWHVLVVEDNEPNQQLVQRVLDSVGVSVDVVASGEEAVAAVERRRYDLVFMDCRLPGMDGLEATREIRHACPVEALPIIGLSASVQSGMRPACLAAGMNDFLSKPARPSMLLDALRRWLPTPPTMKRDGQAVAIGARVAPGNGRFDQDVIDELRRLGVLHDMTDAALRDLPARLGDLRAAVRRSDADTLARIAHRFTTVLGNIGWTRAADLASRVEVACDHPGAAGAFTLAQAFEQEVLAGRAALESLALAAAPEIPC